MALRDQPYLPLYVQDFLTDEKLMECSAQTVGVYIKVMCILHKQEEYGIILLKQKDKQSNKQEINFAYKIAKSLPWSFDIVLASLVELIEENVLHIEGDKLMQKRMIKDAELSEKRAKAGKKGGDKTTKSIPKSKNFAQAKNQANSENEIEYVNEIEVDIKDVDFEQKKELADALITHFGFEEMRFDHHKRTINAFVQKILETGQLENFKEQFVKYHEYKKLSGEKVHNFSGLLGTPAMRFENAAWNSENWQQKIDNFNKSTGPKSKFEKTTDVFADLFNDMKNGNSNL